MKPLFSLTLLIVLSSVAAQDKKTSDSHSKLTSNELKINAPYLLIGEILDVEFERIISDESSFGITVGLPLSEDVGLRFLSFPYYRIYFGKKRAAGFFFETHGSIITERMYNFSICGNSESYEDYTSAGLGIAIGGKFKTNNGFVVDLLLGVGRSLISKSVTEVYPRFGISAGKRF